MAEWYFISHEATYLLWPWNFEMRFLLPVAPLACLYLWRGGEVLRGMAVRKERAVGVWGLFVAVPLGVYASISGWGSGSVQPKLAAVFWALAAIAFARVVWMGSYRLLPAMNRRLLGTEIVVSVWGKSLTLRQVVGVVTVALLAGAGIAQQVSIGRENLSFDVTKQPSYPDIVAARWIQSHTASTAVVMARQLDVVYHYSRRKVVWFPPLSDPRLLIEGMRKHEVEFVIVVSRNANASYWLPPDQDCFEPILKREPAAFRLVHEGPRYRIFTVVRDSLFGVPATPG